MNYINKLFQVKTRGKKNINERMLSHTMLTKNMLIETWRKSPTYCNVGRSVLQLGDFRLGSTLCRKEHLLHFDEFTLRQDKGWNWTGSLMHSQNLSRT